MKLKVPKVKAAKVGLKFKRRGPGLKPGVNEADTGSVVGKVKSHFKVGR